MQDKPMQYFSYSRDKEREGGPTCIDLFAGAGGLAEGFRQAGFVILAGTDINGFAGSTFRHNFPEASFFLGDISGLSGERLLEDSGLEPGELDCLIGGPPCQAFSYNNHQRSMDNVRAGLFRQYLRIVEELMPKVLVMENVPGILTIGDGAVVTEIINSLATIGYECKARILYAEEFGVPQERRRVIFIATRLGWEDALFPPGEYGPVAKSSNPLVHNWRKEPGRRYPKVPTVWDAIGDLPSLTNGGGRDDGMRYAKPATKKFQKKLKAGQRAVFNHVAPCLSETLMNRIVHVPEGGNWRDIPRDLLSAGMKRAKLTCHTKRYGRLRRNGLCCTILTKSDPHWGSYIHPLDDRAITVREAARMQTFPDKFKFLGPKTYQFEQVGNAVPPAMAFAIGSAVVRHLAHHHVGNHTSSRRMLVNA